MVSGLLFILAGIAAAASSLLFDGEGDVQVLALCVGGILTSIGCVATGVYFGMREAQADR